MPIVFEPAGLAYFSVPKCACSSLKMYFFQLENGHRWAEARQRGEKMRLHEKYPSIPFRKVALRNHKGLEKLAVIREPVARLVSCYNNKIVKINVLMRPNAKPAAERRKLDLTPDFETFFRRLDEYRAVSGPIRRHTEPLSFWLGKDPAIYEHLYDVSKIDAVEELIASRLDGQDIPPLPHSNKTAGAQLTTRDLDPGLRARIEERYREDFTLFGEIFTTH